MKLITTVRLGRVCPGLLAGFAALLLGLTTAVHADDADFGGSWRLRLSTETFQDGGLVPDIMASNNASVGAQTCTLDNLPGGDQSPQLSWRNVPPGTRTFTIVMYDETASFTHWAIYNIPRDVSSLPAGVAPNSTLGTQAYNDFFTLGYGGPCPPVGVTPTTHQYTITVYALADQLDVVNLANFPAYGESVYQALIKAARRGAILESATLTVFDSTTPPSD